MGSAPDIALPIACAAYPAAGVPAFRRAILRETSSGQHRGDHNLVFAGLSLLGLGTIPPAAEWGAMVGEGRPLVQQWWVATFPSLAILSVVMGFNFIGDGLRDWLDPHARSR